MHSFPRLIGVGVLGASLLLSADLRAEPLSVELFVMERKADDRTWDGCPHTSQMLDRLFFNLAEPSPPDPRLLVVDHDRNAREPRGSGCQDRTRCRFASIDVPNGVFGLVFVDYDVKLHDLIDAVVVVPAKAPRWLDAARAMDRLVRQVAGRVAPEGLDPCRPLRAPVARRISVAKKTLDECTPAAPCELGQSAVSFEAGSGAAPLDEWAW